MLICEHGNSKTCPFSADHLRVLRKAICILLNDIRVA